MTSSAVPNPRLGWLGELIVVLGHSECGAVKGAIDGAPLGKLTDLLNRIKPAVEANRNAPGEHTSKNKDFVQQVATTNARLAAQVFTETAKFFGSGRPERSQDRCGDA